MKFCLQDELNFANFVFFSFLILPFLVAYISGVYRSIKVKAEEELIIQKELLDDFTLSDDEEYGENENEENK